MNYSTLKYQAEQSLNQCQYPWAQKLYQHCIELEGSERDNYWYLGLTYLLQGQPETAEEIWLSVLLESSLATENQGLEELENVLTNTANRYQKNGYLKAARDIYEHLLQQFPDRADSYNNLGSVLADQGHWEQAIQLYQQGININPNYPQYYANLGWVLSKQGNYVNAYHYLVHATRLEPSNLLYKKWLAIALSSMYFTESNPTTVELIKDCFQQPDIYKNNLVNPSLSLLRLTSEFQQVCQLCQQGSLTIDNCLDFFANQLGQYLLSSTLIAQLEIENILTILRKTILLSFNPKELYKPPIFDFICALANQCFNNEYIFQLTEQEKKEVNKIQLTIETILVDFNPDVLNLNDLEILLSILCLYEPIYILKNAEKLLKIPEKKWSLTFYPLLEKTLINYYREKEIQRSLLTLTKIEQKTSLLVQSQYEENPYPRWLGMTILPAEPITTVLGNIFPYFEVPEQLIGQKLEVLIAGCGTGAEAISTAIKYTNVNILAVDISSSSLAYATRMANRYSLNNITFAQADILSLSTLTQKFNLIFSTGVIHHLEQPLEGLKVLTNLLAPSGLIKLGLYSKTARRSVQKARNFIANNNYLSTPEDLRKCRQEIIKLANIENIEWAKEIISIYDFYSLSNCRDLIFHVCEHCFTIPQLQTIMQQFNLDFIGLQVNSSTRQLYHKMFPNDLKMNKLEQWHQLEEAHPLTFISMYNFWCRKKEVILNPVK